jgi:hypothetical protein
MRKPILSFTDAAGNEAGFSPAHLLALHLTKNSGTSQEGDLIEVLFSTRAVRIEGSNLRPLWQALASGKPIEPLESGLRPCRIRRVEQRKYQDDPPPGGPA